ncbi:MULTISPECIES: hypothetical protein [Peribacillus]|uniref:hypothetical protein n=1 Tax=Peribacillus TaxID=2675229 RepID=UPI001595B18D|nr:MULTISPECIES: hypothetical protein [Peribacillus]MBD8590989.1 hypothetical protein [Peribacillus simplex]MCM3169591.1 PcfB family protein [Peribacillus frigoritolerans]MEE3955829.1 hypothetical protein [Peribacillus frigoritolerans]
MANADELTHVGMEIVVQGTKLSGEVLLKILESISRLFEKNSENREYIIKDNTKEGQQRIKDLVKKHKEGVMALDDNVNKEQMNDYVKEFKKLGVDFSVVKNEKDDFSFFFSAKDANVIEKSLKNIVEKKSKNLEVKKGKNVEKDLEIEPSDRIKNIEPIAAYAEALVLQENYGLSSNKVEWNNEKFLNHLKEVDPQAHKDFLHLKALDSQFIGEKKIDKDMTDKPLIKEFDSKEQQLDHIYKQLTPKEKDLFKQLNKVQIEGLDNFYADSSSHKESKYFDKLAESFSDESISKVSKLYHENMDTSNLGDTPKGKIHMDTLSNVEDNLEKMKQGQRENPENKIGKGKQIQPQNQKEKPAEQSQNKAVKPQEYSLRAVKEIDTKLKEDNKNQDKNRTKQLSR